MRRISTIAAGTLLTLGLLGVGSVVVYGILWSGPESITVASAYTPPHASASSTTPSSIIVEYQNAQYVPPAKSPFRLRIASLNIDVHVQHQGLNAAGRMATPTNFKDVAWYTGGALPGDMGNTIIAGHVDNGLGLPAVFRHLSEIQKGSVIEVETHNGTVLRFEVTGVESLLYAESSQKIFVGTEAPQLVLVTCDGTWLPDEKTYNRRLVVYAKLLP